MLRGLSRAGRRRGAGGCVGALAAAVLAAALSACGGGGGGATMAGGGGPGAPEMPAPSPPPAPPPISNPSDPPQSVAAFSNHPEYFQEPDFTELEGGGWVNPFGRHSLRPVRAAWAYARIQEREGAFVAPGTGVTIAVIDTGIDLDHWEFDGARLSRTALTCCEAGSPAFPHGTAVTSIIAAQRDQPRRAPDPDARAADFHGAAWGATVKVFPIFLGGGFDGPYTPITLEELREEGVSDADALRQVLSDPDGIDIVNMSFGYAGLSENYQESGLRGALAGFIRVAAQGDRAPGDRTLLVRAAANDHGAPCAEGSINCTRTCERRNEQDEVVETFNCLDASSPTVFAGLPAHIEELRGHWVAVVATHSDEANTIADFSNRCGIAARWCIAAPGNAVRVAGSTEIFGDDGRLESVERIYAQEWGTSFSAPLVAAGLAVLKHYFRGQLGHHELLDRLLVTADVTPDPVPAGGRCPAHLDLDGDRSDCELSSTHGRGTMDLDAATRPVGGVSVALGERVDGARVAASASALRGGAAFGDALALALRGREMAVFDRLGAPFWVDLGGFAGAAARPGLEDRLARLLAPAGQDHAWRDGLARTWPGGGAVEMPFASTRLRVALGRGAGGSWPEGGHMSLLPLSSGGVAVSAGERWQASAFFASRRLGGEEFEAARAAGASLAWRPGPVGARLGVIREFEGALATRAHGGFGSLSSDTAFMGADVRAGLEGWRLSAAAELGMVDVRAGGGLVRGASRLATSAFHVSGERSLSDGGLLRLSLSRPLRAEKGRLALSVPGGRDRRGVVLRDALSVPVRPSGQQLDVSAAWRRPAGGGELRLGSVLSLQPGHVAGRSPELSLLAGWRLAF